MTRESPYRGLPGEEASGGKSRKEVYVYPLAKRCREVLRNGPPPAFAPEDAFVRLWGNVIGTVVRVANEHDRLWQQRRRVLNTLLVTLFVFRLVFSKDRQGYATTVAGLWEQCRMMGIALPQATPVAASAMCRARAKLDEGLFRRLHGEILREAGAADAGKRWKGRRIFAVVRQANSGVDSRCKSGGKGAARLAAVLVGESPTGAILSLAP